MRVPAASLSAVRSPALPPPLHPHHADLADPLLEQVPGPVAHLGIDEHRRGRPRWRADAETGEYVLLADRWHTCFLDLSGDQGL